jgi:metallo-beta-lactamase family protein
MLKDSAHIQESDAEFVNRRAHRRRSIGVAANGDAVASLYTQADAEQTVQQFKPVTMHTPQMLAGSTADAGFTTTTFDAWHMLGSTCVLAEAREKGQTTRLLFSGDVGQKGLPIIKDSETAPVAEYLIMEST